MRRRDALLGLAGALSVAACRRERGAALWYAYGGKNREVLLQLVDRFHREQDRYRVVPTYQGDYFESLAKLRTALHAGVPPAITHVVGEVVPYLAAAGVLQPLDALGDIAALEKDLVPALTQRGMFEGGAGEPLYAIPFNRSTPIAYFNGNVLDEIGLAPPTTWDELRAFARAATKRGADRVERWGFECPIDWWYWVALVGQAGGVVATSDGTIDLGGSAGVRAIELWRALADEDATMKIPAGRDFNSWQAMATDFLAGHIAMIWTSTAFLTYIEERARFPVIVAPLPRQERHAVPTGGTMFVLPKAGPPSDRDAAIAFLSFMMRADVTNEFATKTGYIPVSVSGQRTLEAEGHYEGHPNERVAVDQLGSAVKWPWLPELFRVQREVVQPRLEQVMLERRDIEATLDEARREAKQP